MSVTALDIAIQVAAKAHAGQRRKYTGEPYIVHPLEVVTILLRHGLDYQDILCAAVLHDVLEDCGWDEHRLYAELLFCSDGYDWGYAVELVKELTEPAHEGNRAMRKKAEAIRLGKVSPEAQTIKCADLISNTASIVCHDAGFAKVYLAEKSDVLSQIMDAQKSLWDEAFSTLVSSRATALSTQG